MDGRMRLYVNIVARMPYQREAKHQSEQLGRARKGRRTRNHHRM